MGYPPGAPGLQCFGLTCDACDPGDPQETLASDLNNKFYDPTDELSDFEDAIRTLGVPSHSRPAGILL